MYDERCSTYASGPDAQLAWRDELAGGHAGGACPARRLVRYPVRVDDVSVVVWCAMPGRRGTAGDWTEGLVAVHFFR